MCAVRSSGLKHRKEKKLHNQHCTLSLFLTSGLLETPIKPLVTGVCSHFIYLGQQQLKGYVWLSKFLSIWEILKVDIQPSHSL